MTSATHTTESSGTSTGRPAVFGVLLTVALLGLFVVLIGGPQLPLGASVTLLVLSTGLVGIGWRIAGPSLR